MEDEDLIDLGEIPKTMSQVSSSPTKVDRSVSSTSSAEPEHGQTTPPPDGTKLASPPCSLVKELQPHVPPSSIINLRVGESLFTVNKDTLIGGSRYFQHRFSSQWDMERLPDGSYFLDADGDAFKYVLRYLRHYLFPILWTHANGFDLSMYAAIFELANVLMIDPLAAWIKDRKFLTSIVVTREVVVKDNPVGVHHQVIQMDKKSTYMFSHVTSYPVWDTQKVYSCPRGIPSHRGNELACGKACIAARRKGDADEGYESRRVLRMVEIRETTKLAGSVSSTASL